MARDDLFTVVHEQFITDTARYADIVLPATTQIEATDVVTAWGHLWLGWNEAAIEPRGEAVSNSELFRRLAAGDGLHRAGAVRRRPHRAPRARCPDVDLDELRRVGFVRTPHYPDGRPAVRRRPCSPPRRGKVELRSDDLVAHRPAGAADVRRPT